MRAKFFLAAFVLHVAASAVFGLDVASELDRIAALHKSGDHAGAFAAIDALILAAPDDPRGYFLRGKYNLISNDKVAIESFTKGLQLDPRNGEALWYRGLCYTLEKLYGKAEADFLKAITVDPRYIEAYCSLGDVYSAEGKFKAASCEYWLALTVDWNSASPWYGLGKLYYEKLGYPRIAISYVSKAIDLKKNDARSYVLRSSCYKDLKIYDLALQDLNEVMQRFPNYPYILKLRARVEAESGDFYQAGKDYYADYLETQRLLSKQKK